jgi:ATP-dependent RNA helicase DeaD
VRAIVPTPASDAHGVTRPTSDAAAKLLAKSKFVSKRSYRSKPWLAATPKASRATPADFTRLYINLGAEHGLATGDIVGAILGETGLPSKTVGVIDLRARHAFVDVASEHANAVIAKLNRAQIKGNKVKIKTA